MCRQKMVSYGIGHLEITKHLTSIGSDDFLKLMMMQKTKCLIRVYMISGFAFASRDNGGDSDPYLVLSLGNQVHNERDNYQEDQPNPEFHKKYDFQSTFPGCP